MRRKTKHLGKAEIEERIAQLVRRPHDSDPIFQETIMRMNVVFWTFTTLFFVSLTIFFVSLALKG